MVFKSRPSARQPKQGRVYKRFISLLLITIMVVATMLFGPATIFAPRASASALSFICASSAAATSTAACTGEQAGDLLLVTAGDAGSGTIPTLATGFTNINTAAITTGAAANRIAIRAGWITAAASSTTSGTWTSATDVVMQVFRGQAASPIGNNTPTTGTPVTTVTYPADALTATDGSSWFVGQALRNTGDSQMSTAPTNMTNRSSAPATPLVAGHDTNGPTASNWPSTNVTGFGAAAGYASIVIELKAAPTITVGTSGSQLSNLTIPSVNDFVGGTFKFVRDVGTANITSIKIHDSGTVNANTNISNVILFYKQEAVCSSSIPSGTTQFNSTVGTFNASEDSTMTGTITVTTSQFCLYVQVNVGSGAASGNTLDLQITNPSTDVVVSVGTASPASVVSISGTTTLSLPTPDQFLRGGELFSGETKQRFYWAQ